jgi:Domain of unknown function (DUF5664)
MVEMGWNNKPHCNGNVRLSNGEVTRCAGTEDHRGPHWASQAEIDAAEEEHTLAVAAERRLLEDTAMENRRRRDQNRPIIEADRHILANCKTDDSKCPTANPKDLVGATKAPLDYFPAVAILQGSRAMMLGAQKYGRANWRDYPVKRTICLGAALRHILADLDGETIDPETITADNPQGTPHIALALAGLGIMLDADSIGNLIDDRPAKGGYADLARKLFPPKVKPT